MFAWPIQGEKAAIQGIFSAFSKGASSMKVLRFLLVLSFLFSIGAFTAPVSAQTGVPVGVEITSATLSVYVNDPTTQQVSAHRITSGWVEREVTWNSFAGAYAPLVLDTFVPAAGWNTVDLTALVQEWVNGSEPNYGVLLGHDALDPTATLMTGFVSSDDPRVELRPKLEICFMVVGSDEQCITVQRSGSEAVDVFDSEVSSITPDKNFGAEPVIYTRSNAQQSKQVLLRFEIPVEVLQPGITLVKYTNGAIASDPNGSDVPRLNPGDTVEWTYRITNTGETAVPREQIVVTDNQPGVTPVFEEEVTGDGDTVFEPLEVWNYHAMGVAVDLQNPPADMITVQDACSGSGSRPGSTAYVNLGSVTIPGASASAPSSYCNVPESSAHLYWIPISYAKNPLPELEDYQVSVGYEDLPLLLARNDYDYNDWVVEITFLIRRLPSDPDMIDQIIFDFTPGARGSVYNHTFNLNLPAGTFDSNGTTSLSLLDSTGRVVRTTPGTFTGASRSSFEIFSSTRDVYPVNQTNTFESSPLVTAQRTATLTINFDEPVNFSEIAFSLAEPHGEGLFFEPQIRVLNTGNVIGRGDVRMLTVPQFQWSEGSLYMWPEEYARIDRVYPLVTFHAGNPPAIDFPEGWWREHNDCSYDGLVCTAIP
jgi:hypothetical protein